MGIWLLLLFEVEEEEVEVSATTTAAAGGLSVDRLLLLLLLVCSPRSRCLASMWESKCVMALFFCSMTSNNSLLPTWLDGEKGTNGAMLCV